ncbi:MAG: family 10 glycosylhydrolase [Bacilli bacterium]|nr:family 10 glycosylhydrolase [Bacilli bacterium]
MKKIIFIIVLSIIIIIINSLNAVNEIKYEDKGIFISYIELDKYVKNKSVNISKKNIDNMINNIKKNHFNTVILQVRSNCDAIYDSKIFPYNLYSNDKSDNKKYDVLEYFIKKAHKNNLKLIAWINPYRVRTNDDVSSISEESPAYKYIDTDILYVNHGIYLNPSKKEVEDLIIDGVNEVLKYDVDGILFDDYFYPSNDIDNNDYENYLKSNVYISKEQYHLNIINHMIKRVYKNCKKKHVLFGVSPDGNIDNNYNKNYADVKRWMEEDGYIDFIMPQVYYGFYNSTKDYVKVIHEWEDLLKNDNINLYIALAFYKVGIEDNYAKEGKDEWVINNNIIMREVLLSRNLKNYKGFSLFRYDNVFDVDHYTNNSIEELENLKKIINY